MYLQKGKINMKLYFEIRKIAEDENSRRRNGKDNIPMINKAGEVWFLWDKSLIEGDLIMPRMKNVYKLKKVG